jgi:perosamine synthetase
MELAKEKNFSKELRPFGEVALQHLKDVLNSGWQTSLFNEKGKVHQFQSEFAKYIGAETCLARANGMLSLAEAVSVSGAKAGNEIICDPVVHFGALASLYYNCIPRFCDIDPDTYNMNPESLKANITDNTTVVICTHLWGLADRIDEIRDICRENNLFLIEDCAHAIGTKWNGQHVGTFGDMGMFSLQEFKQLSTGDGAMSVIRDPELADKLENIWAFSGESPVMMTLNWRMTEVTAAMGLAQLSKMDEILSYYDKTLGILNGAVKDCKWLKNRLVRDEATQSGYWFACKWEGDKHGFDYAKFKKLNQELEIGLRFGFNEVAPYQYDFFKKGDIYGNGVPFHTPPFTKMSDYKYRDGLCPVVEDVMPRLVTVSLIFLSIDEAKEVARKLRKAVNIMERDKRCLQTAK